MQYRIVVKTTPRDSVRFFKNLGFTLTILCQTRFMVVNENEQWKQTA